MLNIWISHLSSVSKYYTECNACRILLDKNEFEILDFVFEAIIPYKVYLKKTTFTE